MTGGKRPGPVWPLPRLTAMNFDDKSFLTAYLDGALSPEQRLQVESAVLSDARLSEDLRELGAVRDLVAGLSRPAPAVDLTDAVLARLAQRRALVPGRLLATPGGHAAILLATAAVLLVIATVTVVTAALRTPRFGRPHRLVARVDRPAPPLPVAEAPRVEQPAPKPAPSARLAAASPEPDPRLLVPDHEERLRDLELQKVRRLLDSPNLRTVYVISDTMGGRATRQVGEILDQIERKHAVYLRLQVGPEVAIDPEHPGAASVFAVLADDREQKLIRDRLRKEFPFEFEETAPKPESVTLLSEVSQVSVFPGKAVANVRVPEGPAPAMLAPQPTTIPLRPRVPGLELLPEMVPPPGPEPEHPAAREPLPPARAEVKPGPDAKALPGAAPVGGSTPPVILVWVVEPPAEARPAR
jgi:hypothetical protein